MLSAEPARGTASRRRRRDRTREGLTGVGAERHARDVAALVQRRAAARAAVHAGVDLDDQQALAAALAPVRHRVQTRNDTAGDADVIAS